MRSEESARRSPRRDDPRRIPPNKAKAKKKKKAQPTRLRPAEDSANCTERAVPMLRAEVALGCCFWR